MIHRDTPDFSAINTYGQTFAHAVARSADLTTVSILTEAEHIVFDPDTTTRDLDGRISLQYCEERLESLPHEEAKELQSAFLGLLKRLKRSQQQASVLLPECDLRHADTAVATGSLINLEMKMQYTNITATNMISVVEDGEFENVFEDAIEVLV